MGRCNDRVWIVTIGLGLVTCGCTLFADLDLQIPDETTTEDTANDPDMSEFWDMVDLENDQPPSDVSDLVDVADAEDGAVVEDVVEEPSDLDTEDGGEVEPADLDMMEVEPVDLDMMEADPLDDGMEDGDVEVDADPLGIGVPCIQDRQCVSNNCSNEICAPVGFTSVPAGNFWMGSPDGSVADPGTSNIRPAEPGRGDDELLHEVSLTRSFFIGTHEVTQGRWQEVATWWNDLPTGERDGLSIGTIPSYQSASGWNFPVEQVSWWDVILWLNAASRMEGLGECYSLDSCAGSPGDGCGEGSYGDCMGTFTCSSVTVTAPGAVPYQCEGYRLPTEAEWEYAARAGQVTAYYNGEEADADYMQCETPFHLTAIAWYCGNEVPEGTRGGGGLLPNDFGVFDMYGNVWEWTWDWYARTYSPGPDINPTGPLSGECGTPYPGSCRIPRGGGFRNGAQEQRSANRGFAFPDQHFRELGFRVVRTNPEDL